MLVSHWLGSLTRTRHTHRSSQKRGGLGNSQAGNISRVERLEDRTLLAFGTPIINVAGQGFSNVGPPDTVGDVGISHYVHAINGPSGARIEIYNKSDGTVAVPQFDLDTLAATATGGLPYAGAGDPIVLYDHLADRWLLLEFDPPGGGDRLHIFISDTGTPTGNGTDWTHYRFTAPNFPDYPKMALWTDAYFIGANEADNPVYALPRQQMLTGSGGDITANVIRRTATDLPNWLTNLTMPADLDGSMTPAPGAPGVFVRHNDDEVTTPGTAVPGNDFLEVWEFSPNFVTPALSTFTMVANIPIADFDRLIGANAGAGSPDIEQPGTANELDSIPHFIMWRLQYRNFGTHESLVANFTHDVGEDATPDIDGGTAAEQAGIRWFELRKVGAGSWTLFQEGDIAPDTNHRWMGSAAMDGDGNIAVGYSVSSTTVSPGIRYSGRRVGDPLGTLPQGEHVLIGGTGAVTVTNRWGDYSALTVDPVDDRTFWYTTEYSDGSGNWATRIGSFAFDPITVYVDDDWDALPIGTQISDGDNNPLNGNQPVIIGSNAFATIQEGQDAVAVGGTVNVNDGIYSENVTIDRPLTLLGLTGTAADVVVDPSAGPGLHGIVIATAGDVEIRDLRVDGAMSEGIRSSTAGLDLRLDNVESINNGRHGVALLPSGVLLPGANSLFVDGGVYSNNSVSFLEGDGIHAESIVTSVTLQNNVTATGNVRGVFVNGAASYTDTGTNASTNSDHGFELANITGDVMMTGVTANDNDSDNSGPGGGDGIHMDNIGGAVTLVNVTANGNDPGVFVNGALSFTDTDGVYTLNNDGGIVLIDIAGDVILTRTQLDDNDADGDNVGDGLNISDGGDGDALAIDGDLIINGARIRDTDAAGAAFFQNNGILVTHAIDGDVVIDGSSDLVSIFGNDAAGAAFASIGGDLIADNAMMNRNATNLVVGTVMNVMLDGGSYSDSTVGNGIDIDLTMIGDLMISNVTADDNAGGNLVVLNADDVMISGSSFDNGAGGLGIDITMSGALDVSSTTADGNNDDGLQISGTPTGVTITGGSFSGNGTGSSGRGIDLGSIGGDVMLVGGVIADGNQDENLFVMSAANVTITGGSFSNSATSDGIDIDASTGTVTISNATLNGNADDGFDIATAAVEVDLSDLTMLGNTDLGGDILDTPTVTFTATSDGSKTIDLVDVNVMTRLIEHTRAGVSQDPIQYDDNFLNDLSVLTADGDDEVQVQFGPGLPMNVAVDGGLPNASDSVTVFGTMFDDIITAAGSMVDDGTDTVTLSNVEHLTIDASQGGKDEVHVFQPVSLSGASPSLAAKSDGAGMDTLFVNSPTGNFDQTIDVDATSVNVTGELPIAYSMFEFLEVLADDGSDTFQVSPSTSTEITVRGGDPMAPTMPGDTLLVEPPPGEMSMPVGGLPDGMWTTTGGFLPIHYFEIEATHIGGDITINGTPLGDTLELVADGPDSGTFQLNAGPIVSMMGVTSFTFNGLGGNDIFRLIMNPGVFRPVGGIFFDGGAPSTGPGDSIELEGTVENVIYDFDNASDGSISFPDDVGYAMFLACIDSRVPIEDCIIADNTRLRFSNIEPITDSTTAGNRVFVFGDTDNFIVVDEMGSKDFQIRSNASETVDFLAPTNDVLIFGDGGNDEIHTLAAKTPAQDFAVFGGDGRDTLRTGDGADTLSGGNGGNFLYGGGGIDIVLEAADSDFLLTNPQVSFTGTDGKPALSTFYQIEQAHLTGGFSKNTLDATAFTLGSVTLDGGVGEDTLHGSPQADSLFGNGGDDLLNGNAGDDTLDGGLDNDTVNGGNGADCMTGGDGDDELNGGAGNDTLGLGTGTDDFNGDEGRDLVFAQSLHLDPDGPIDIAITSARELTIPGGASFDQTTYRLNGVETAFISAGADISTAAAIDVSIFHWDEIGQVTIVGSDQDDTINGGGNADSLVGNMGDDEIDGGNSDDTILGNDGNDIILGGRGPDIIDGGDGDDVINGQGGADSIVGGSGINMLTGNGGADTIEGGPNNDTIIAGNGPDRVTTGHSDTGDSVEGGNGSDSIVGSSMPDELRGGNGRDTIFGGSEGAGMTGDSIFGGDHADLLFGEGGKDTIDGNGGNDTIEGGADNDQLLGRGDKDLLFGGDGDDALSGHSQPDTLFGGDGNDVVNGGEDDDSLSGGEGNDMVLGGDGSDTIVGGEDTIVAPADTFLGGNGTDFDIVLVVVDADFTLTSVGGDIDMSVLTKDPSGTPFVDLLNGIEGVFYDNTAGDLTPNFFDAFTTGTDAFVGATTMLGSAGADCLFGGNGADSIVGGTGGDTIDGNGDEDTIFGGEVDGTDDAKNVITGGGADDTIVAGHAGDDVNGGGGADCIQGGNGADTLSGNAGDDTIFGGKGNDLISGNDDDDSLRGDDGADTIFTGDGFDTVDGGIGDDSIVGTAMDVNLLMAVANAHFALTDTALTSPGGFGYGNDSLTLIQTAHIVGGDDDNYIDASAFTGATTLVGDDGDDTLLGGTASDSLVGGNGLDSIEGGMGDDVILGGGGGDIIHAGDGDDSVVGQGGGDNIDLGSGMDTADGGNGSDTITAGDGGGDSLVGGGGHDSISSSGPDGDRLYGGDGNDTLDGGAGNDCLSGGNGSDLVIGGPASAGSDGDDILVGSIGADTLLGGAGNDSLAGGADDDTIDGENGSDTVDGGTGANAIMPDMFNPDAAFADVNAFLTAQLGIWLDQV